MWTQEFAHTWTHLKRLPALREETGVSANGPRQQAFLQSQWSRSPKSLDRLTSEEISLTKPVCKQR